MSAQPVEYTTTIDPEVVRMVARELEISERALVEQISHDEWQHQADIEHDPRACLVCFSHR